VVEYKRSIGLSCKPFIQLFIALISYEVSILPKSRSLRGAIHSDTDPRRLLRRSTEIKGVAVVPRPSFLVCS